MDVCPLWLSSLRRTDQSSRRIPPNVVCPSVIL
jgi:hypothetical protein